MQDTRYQQQSRQQQSRQQQSRQQSLDELSTPLWEVTYCVLDLETTGGSAATCEITEIGAVKYRGGEPAGTFQTLVNPGCEIPPTITILTGITHAMVVNAPHINEALPTFLEFIGDAVIVGHNVRFDMAFLNAAAQRLGYGKLANTTVDTAALARRLVRQDVRNLKLSTLAAHFRSPITPNHRALADAQATAHVMFRLLEQSGSLGTTHLDDLLLLCSAKGGANYAKIELTEDLPRLPGVYLFRNRDGEVIYVGKAKNLRSRVRQYFHGDTRRTIASMLRDLNSIEYRVCPTELEAEITELRLIAAHRPTYNRRGRPSRSTYWVKLTPERFPRLSIARTLKEDGGLYLGPYKQRKRAQLIVAALWDATLGRRCTGPPGKRRALCAPAQLGRAMCPCDGSLSVDDYRPVVDLITAGFTDRPELLLTPLAERITDCVAQLRYEDAARLRDRYDGLRASLIDRMRWQALQTAGSISAEIADGSGFCLLAGRLVGSWGPGELPLQADMRTTVFEQVPTTAEAAAEARLIWRWLDRDDAAIIGSIALTTASPPELSEAVRF